MQAQVVLGAAFGDEGKGLVTDYLCSQAHPPPLVVRFNGGAQAAHTVQNPEGLRHVFRHIGSGALIGSPTFLSEFFIINPMDFMFEVEHLIKLHQPPRVLVHPDSLVTTPYDMMINMILEEQRGANKHGSCGLGINETVERSQHKDYMITVKDLFSRQFLFSKLEKIREVWLPKRLKACGITQLDATWQPLIAAKNILLKFLESVEYFKQKIEVAQNSVLQEWEQCMFEGAQGLLLDQNSRFFPYVTRSNTGIKNVLSLLENQNIDSLNIYYVTRAYLTRHGAGPLPFELPKKPYDKIEDKTNQPNAHQDQLRFSWLNFDLLKESIQKDYQLIPLSFAANKTLAITCLDQIIEPISFIYQNEVQTTPLSELLSLLKKELQLNNLLVSYGPTRSTITGTVNLRTHFWYNH